MHRRIFAFHALFCLVFFGKVLADQQVKIVNDSNQPLAFAYTIPAYHEAVLKLKKLSKPQLQLVLLKAIMKDSAEDVMIAVQAGADVEKEIAGKKPLVVAVENNKVNAVKALGECGADYNIIHEGLTLCSWSIRRKKSVDIVLYLICRSAKLSDVHTTMHEAIGKYGPGKVVLELLKRYDINQVNHSILSKFLSSPTNTQFFLANGLDPNMMISHGEFTYTPLFIASHGGYGSLKMLLEAGARPNQKCLQPKGRPDSALANAIERGHSDIIELLLAYGAHL